MSPSKRNPLRSLCYALIVVFAETAVGCGQPLGEPEAKPDVTKVQRAALSQHAVDSGASGAPGTGANRGAAAPGDGEPVDRNNPALSAQREREDPDYRKARLAADRAALATQRSALTALERARMEGKLSTEEARELEARIEALRGRIAKRQERTVADEKATK